MRVLVTGATGFVGGHATAALLAAGDEVTALVRSPDRLAATMAAFGHPVPAHVVGDMTDPSSVRHAIEGVDAVLHCAAVVSLGRGDTETMIRTNAEGAETVLGVAAEHGADPIVHVSSTSALFEPGVGPLTTDHRPTETTLPYGRAKAACERVARRLQDEGAPVVIVYPGGVLGPAAGTAFGEAGEGMSGFLAGGVMPTRQGALSIVDVRDLAAILRAVMEPGRGPRRLMCGGHLLDVADLADIFRSVTGRRFPTVPTPAAVLRAAGRLMDGVSRFLPVDSGLTEEGMTVFTRWEGTVDTDLASLGLSLRPPEETIAAAIAGWHDAGLISDRQAGHTSR